MSDLVGNPEDSVAAQMQVSSKMLNMSIKFSFIMSSNKNFKNLQFLIRICY